MYKDQKIAKLRMWTTILDRATIVVLTIAALYIQLAFSMVLSNWFRLLLGSLAMVLFLIGFWSEMARITRHITENLARIRGGKYSLDNRL
ncbi:MAG: hypothetical protein P1R58_01695 [bacterium]|nr:hypothetical protein [bacterium]